MAITVSQSATRIRALGLITLTVEDIDVGYSFLRFHTSVEEEKKAGPAGSFSSIWQYVDASADLQSEPGNSIASGRVWYYKIRAGRRYTFTYKARPGIVGFQSFFVTATSKPDALGNFLEPDEVTVNVEVTDNPDTVAPDPPTSFTATAQSAVRIRLAWVDASDNEYGFEIYRARSATDSYVYLTQVGEGATTYDDDDLLPQTTYFYKIRAVNLIGASAFSSVASAMTQVAPPPPAAPSGLTAMAIDATRIDLSWTDNSSNEDGFRIYRSGVQGATHPLIDEVGAGETSYTDIGVAPNTPNYYRVAAFNTGGISAQTSEASATTPQIPPTTGTASPFYMDPRSRISSVQVADSLMVFSDYSRAHVLADNTWTLAGMKPLLTGATISNGGVPSTAGFTGTYTVYLCLKFGERKRSVPSPVSNSLTITNRKITIVPPNDGTTVTLRDQVFDIDGNSITDGLTWEIYLYEQNLEIPVRIAELPITTLTYTTGNNETIADLDPLVKRPMEISRESQIGPAAAYAKVYADRVHSWGEITFKPDFVQTSGGANLTIANGSTTCTVTGVDWLEALWMKEVWVNGKSSGWFVIDIEGTTVYLYHKSPEKYAAGWQLNDAAGDVVYRDFAFAPVSNRMSRSAKFAGEAGGNLTIYFQSMPPLADIGAELFPDDNQAPIAAETARGVLFVAKRSKWLFLEGGGGLDESADGSDRPSVQLIADNTGVLSPKSVVVDGDGNILCLSDSGPTMVSRAGVRRLGLINGTTFLLKDYFDIKSAFEAVAEWFPREEYYVCANLNKIGNSGHRDGFIYEARTGRVVFFDNPRRFTALRASQTNDGDFQMLIGDDGGGLGVFLQKGIYTDNVNFMQADPYSDESEYDWHVTTGVYTTDGNMTVGRYRVSLKQKPLTAPLDVTISIDAEPQTSNPTVFEETVSATYATDDSRPFYRINKWRTQAARFKISGTSSRTELLQLRNMLVEINETDSGQDQDD